MIWDCFNPTIDFDDDRVPKSICTNCRLLLNKKKAGEAVILPDTLDFKSLPHCGPTTRQNPDYDCYICKKGRQNILHLGKTITDGRKKTLKEKEEKKVNSICSKCGKIIGRGIDHQCNQSAYVNNLMHYLPMTVREQLAAKTIKEKLDLQNSVNDTLGPIEVGHCASASGDVQQLSSPGSLQSKNQGLVYLKTSGTSFPVFSRPMRTMEKKMTTENLEEVMKNERLSERQTQRFEQKIRQVFGRNSVQSNAIKTLRKNSHSEDDFFTNTTFTFLNNDKEKTTYSQTVPIVKSVQDYLVHVCNERNIDIHKTRVKIGIDDGQGYLKGCFKSSVRLSFI